MLTERILHVVDSHTMGEPTRFVPSFAAAIAGDTMRAKQRFVQERLGWLRRGVLGEPRGHEGMFGAVLTASVSPEADFGLVFVDPAGLVDMCVHATLGSVASLVKLGQIDLRAGSAVVRIDTPAGVVSVRVVEDPATGGAGELTIEGVPSYVIQRDASVMLAMGPVKVDVAYGGNVFVIARAQDLGLRVRRQQIPALVEGGIGLLRAAREQLRLRNPLTGEACGVAQVLLHDTPLAPEATAKNIILSGTNKFDRSPCGSGTCARMSLLHACGELALGEPFINEGIMGTTFTGRLTAVVVRDGIEIVRPEVSGRAFVTGLNQLVFERGDPFGNGFHALRPEAGEPAWGDDDA
jgi:proline racemase